MTPSAYESRERFNQHALERARAKPPWCSAVRWHMELLRRRASGRGRPKKERRLK